MSHRPAEPEPGVALTKPTCTTAFASSQVSLAAPTAVDSLSSMNPAGTVHAPRQGSMARLDRERSKASQPGQCWAGAHTLGSKGYGDPNRFDTEYFRSLLRKPWLAKDDAMAAMIGLPSDHVLPDDPECLPYIQRYAEDQEAFFADFAAAYVKLTGLGVAGWA
ncbi:putative L-ascorbate peroxidase 6 [Tetrabaena socialis]|uniref:Putative L-ascorbate peroxidase 6 n=1 Tax=Tetrabaena socialis TaxID=47790 RepID=A0A2J7ZXQ2_9CHLO|nr:putative L-ascorbate peroxidase 6 [Tetrabaena socialis]|eukprot:PNH05035.1 putative L-ascorbate peroxidase 6 [Tetrabaena socialis]